MLSRDDLDAVVVCTPSALHAEHTDAALRAGKHVLCEVPAGLSLAEVEGVASTARAVGREVMVAHTMRFWEPFVALRSIIEEGAVVPAHIIVRSTMLRHSNEGWTGRPRAWTDDVLWHHGAHAVDTAIWLLGQSPAYATGVRGADWSPTGTHMDVGIVLATARGQIASLALSFHSRVTLNDYVVIAEDETFEIRDCTLYGPQGAIAGGRTEAEMQRDGMHAQDLHFIDSLSAGAPVRPSIHDVLPAMRALAQADDAGRSWECVD